MLLKSELTADSLSKSLQNIYENKKKMRDDLENSHILKNDTDLGTQHLIPSTCGVDGSFVVENLLATDLVAGAAVCIEGFIPPQEDRPLYEPQHQAFIEPERHDPDIGSIIRGLVMQMEVFLSAKSTQKVILLDGSFTSRLIQMNQAINANIKINEKSGRQTLTGKKVVENFEQFLKDYQTVLKSSERSQIWASIPKLTTRNEIGTKMGWDNIEWYKDYTDKTILTNILTPGEFTDPVKMEPIKNEHTHITEGINQEDGSSWHLKIPKELEEDNHVRDLNLEIKSAVYDLYVFYYRPHDHSPALRLEIGSCIGKNPDRLAILLNAIKYQSMNSVIMEPYPLYMADRMAKHLAIAIPAFRQIVTQHMATSGPDDSRGIFFNMHSYRTDSGMG